MQLTRPARSERLKLRLHALPAAPGQALAAGIPRMAARCPAVSLSQYLRA
jgi:hypothetical protein